MHTSLVLSFNKYFTISKKKKKRMYHLRIQHILKNLYKLIFNLVFYVFRDAEMINNLLNLCSFVAAVERNVSSFCYNSKMDGWMDRNLESWTKLSCGRRSWTLIPPKVLLSLRIEIIRFLTIRQEQWILFCFLERQKGSGRHLGQQS